MTQVKEKNMDQNKNSFVFKIEYPRYGGCIAFFQVFYFMWMKRMNEKQTTKKKQLPNKMVLNAISLAYACVYMHVQ